MSSSTPSLRPADAPVTPRLAGDLAIWFVIAAELLTFGLLFVAYAVMRARHTQAFDEAQRLLDRDTGAINTVLLIAGSWCVARAVHAMQALGPAAGRATVARWLVAAIACGSGFLALKWHEYALKWAAGIDLSSSDFFMFYYLLTGFHFLHVVAALAILLGLLALTLWRREPASLHALETGAAFWHMVDLLWIVLFPLVYVMR